ncbi:ABC transporter thiamine pyrophosphate-binding lipoprotein p37/Cypl [Mycoplasmopsis pulmonis]|uniref:ABC transporter thiamine pyrophosphate-binding lipoprotein p37/Cypl n=1 Tax=Mycoplasmopsis pulmonis TaxID=2107 RepID=UPI002ACE2EDE|nr:DNA repair protein [Mycoplasmopsis pulmonis]MDZ7293188.1 DNA repair protein [Mycoplasmopsis pulmonis]
MKLKKFKILAGVFLFLPAITFVSCVGNSKTTEPGNKQSSDVKNNNSTTAQKWDKDVSLTLRTQYWELKAEDGKEEKFLKAFSEEFKKLKDADPETKNLDDVNFTIKHQDDSGLVVQGLQTGTDDFGIANVTETVTRQDSESKKLLSKLHTLTRAFKFDKDANAKYVNGQNDDPLRKIATDTNAIFNKEPLYNNWTREAQKWDGKKYEFLYSNPDDLVSFYRGILFIHGTESDLNQIKKAWNEKNWDTFRNFGIISTDNTNSSGKYLLQESLIRKHFNLGQNFTLATDKLNHPSKYKVGRGRDIGQDANFKIAFDEEGSFAWTENKKDGKRYTSKIENGKVEVLTATERLPYDIGSFRKDFDEKQANLIVQTFINLGKSGKDSFGPFVGYNGYKSIANFDEEVRKIFNNAYGQ